MVGIVSDEKFLAWLESKPREWAQAIAARAALRALPIGLDAIGRHPELVMRYYVPAVFRAVAIAWAALDFPADSMIDSAKRSTSSAAYPAEFASTSRAAIAAAYAAETVCYDTPAISAALAVEIGAESSYTAVNAYNTLEAVQADRNWLANHAANENTAWTMSRQSLWLGQPPEFWSEIKERAVTDLLAHDPSYQVWTDWFDRRVRGERAAFNIPGDTEGKENQAILARLADATDEDFWGKGALHVNTTLQGWIDEARARAAAESPLPEQEDGATAYGLNDAGKVDRLPASDQPHLRDAPDQQRNYADIRDAAQELAEEGQRLGARLRRALDRFLASLPEAFEQAEAYPVWRDGNALRRIYRAHRLVADSREPDDARLDPMVGEMLGGLIDLYNLFAFSDDGLRTLDERRVAAQERARADAERAAAKPLVEAALRAPDVATPRALDDLKAETEAETLPPGDPYADQAADQASRVRRNWFAALLSGGKRALNELKKSGKSVREGAERAVGAAITTSILSDWAGITQIYRPVLEFIKDNAEALANYAAIAYGNNPAVTHLIDTILKLWPF